MKGIRMCDSRAVLILVGLLIVHPGAARGEAVLGRLFLSPQERVKLELQRRRGGDPTERAADVPGAVSLPLAPVTVDGYVARSDARDSVWLNARLSHDARPDEAGLDAIADGLPRVRVRLANGSVIRLRVGQTWNPHSAMVTDVLAGNRDSGHDPDGEPGRSVRPVTGEATGEP